MKPRPRKPIRKLRVSRNASLGAGRSDGFTLIELSVVLLIFGILAAIAVPEFMHSVDASRVRDAANQFSALIEEARMDAEQNNATIPVYTGTVQNGANGVFAACVPQTNCPSGGNGLSYVTGDTSVPYGGDVSNGTANNAPGGLQPGFTPAAAGTTLYFSSRGLVVTPSGATYIPSNGVVFYITDSRGDWAAVAVSSIGRSKVWIWNGSGWN